MLNGGAYIIIADDDTDDQDLMAEALRKNECFLPVRPMYDGPAVIDYLLHNQHALPAAIIVDLNMPKAGGYEVLKNVKQNPALRTVPVYVFTTSKQ